jgi:hypothetical protein
VDDPHISIRIIALSHPRFGDTDRDTGVVKYYLSIIGGANLGLVDNSAYILWIITAIL